MNREVFSAEYADGILKGAVPASCITLPPAIVSAVCLSEPGHTNPVREMDVLGLTNFFDHAGDFADTSIIAGLTVAALGVVDRYVPEKYKPVSIIVSSALGAGTAITACVTYEIREAQAKHIPIDSADIMYGNVAGGFVALAFCTAALWSKYKRLSRRPAHAD